MNRLLIEIDKIPIVDTHSHVPLPMPDAEPSKQKGFHYDVSWLLGSTTYAGEFLYGDNWPETKKMLAINVQHAYYRPIRQALVDLYGLSPNEELNDKNVEVISSRLDTKRRNATAWYGEVYQRVEGGPKQAFLGYNRIWLGKNKYAITMGGGKMNNPGRYLRCSRPSTEQTPFPVRRILQRIPGTKLTCGMLTSISSGCRDST